MGCPFISPLSLKTEVSSLLISTKQWVAIFKWLLLVLNKPRNKSSCLDDTNCFHNLLNTQKQANLYAQSDCTVNTVQTLACIALHYAGILLGLHDVYV